MKEAYTFVKVWMLDWIHSDMSFNYQQRHVQSIIWEKHQQMLQKGPWEIKKGFNNVSLFHHLGEKKVFTVAEIMSAFCTVEWWWSCTFRLQPTFLYFYCVACWVAGRRLGITFPSSVCPSHFQYVSNCAGDTCSSKHSFSPHISQPVWACTGQCRDRCCCIVCICWSRVYFCLIKYIQAFKYKYVQL